MDEGPRDSKVVTGRHIRTYLKEVAHLFLLTILFLLFSGKLSCFGQNFGGSTRIFTDFQGFWTSGVGQINPLFPDNTHHLLAFSWNGTIYSTGVDDGSLAIQGISFSPQIYQAFPVRNIQAKRSGTYVGLGQIYDGLDNAISSPPPFEVPPNLSSFLTRGIQGLDFGSGVANIAAGNVIFDFTGIIDVTQIGDGIPDILVSQFADPSSTLDEIFMTDATGNLVGNSLTINHTSIAPVGRWLADFYNLDGLSAAFIKGTRDLRLWVADLSAFGINADNYQAVRSMRYRLNGSSDPAFAAFKVGVFDIVAANDDVDSTFQEATVVMDVLQNDLPREILDLTTLRILSPPSNGTVEVDSETGFVSYLPDQGFSGTDRFIYEICGSSELQCDEAEVSILVMANALPVDFIFVGTKYSKDAGVTVYWDVASQESNAYFEVQVSQDALTWLAIDSLSGQLQAPDIQRYRLTHKIDADGDLYYRIKQVDVDGSYSFSEVVRQELPEKGNFSHIFPNPTERYLYLIIRDLARDPIVLLNHFGLPVEVECTLESAARSLYRLDLQFLPKGIYFLKRNADVYLVKKR